MGLHEINHMILLHAGGSLMEFHRINDVTHASLRVLEFNLDSFETQLVLTRCLLMEKIHFFATQLSEGLDLFDALLGSVAHGLTVDELLLLIRNTSQGLYMLVGGL